MPRLYDERDLRLSYVIWQEGVSPIVVVELLSPGTEKEDLGKLESQEQNGKEDHIGKPPTKWKVYEQILRIPYYVVFSRYTNKMQIFTLQAGHYVELNLSDPRVWMEEIEMGLGIWEGEYKGISCSWLRWYDAEGNWIPTDAERAERRAEYLAQRLRELGIEP